MKFIIKSLEVAFALASLVLGGCGAAVADVQVDDFNRSEIRSAIAVAVAQGVEEPSVAECPCNGSGRSGDGLGPCACGDNCQCEREDSGSSGDAFDIVGNALFERAKNPPVAQAFERPYRCLFFKASWCIPCQTLETVAVEPLKASGKWKVGDDETCHIQFVDFDTQKDLVNRYGVQSIPTVLFIHNGQVVANPTNIGNSQQFAQFYNQNIPQGYTEPQPPKAVQGIIPEVEIELDDAAISKAIGSLKDVMTSGFKVNKYVTVKADGKLNFETSPSPNGINLKFRQPYPKVNAVGGLVTMSITGIKRVRGGLEIELSGAPDLTVRFK